MADAKFVTDLCAMHRVDMLRASPSHAHAPGRDEVVVKQQNQIHAVRLARP